jgi:hypothetical protein
MNTGKERIRSCNKDQSIKFCSLFVYVLTKDLSGQFNNSVEFSSLLFMCRVTRPVTETTQCGTDERMDGDSHRASLGNTAVETPLRIPYITKKIIKAIKIKPRKTIQINSKSILRKAIQIISKSSNLITIMSRMRCRRD